MFLFDHSREFTKDIPEKVKLLPENKNYSLFTKNKKIAPLRFLFKGNFSGFYYSTMYLIKGIISKIKSQKLYIGWNDIKYMFEKLDKSYDTSIAFLERKSIYFNIDKVNSKNKIGFIHNDYSKYPYDDKLDRYYFSYYNKIATVSEHCKEVLIELFPEYKNKFIVIKNMISKDLIYKLASEPITNYSIDKSYINLVSVGRLNYQKGFDEAIDICKKLIDENIQIKWYIVGTGEERKKLENKIKEFNISDTLFLVGADTNPYKWMNIADIYVQPSRFEGYGITVAEAKSLNKPIIARDIPEFRELLGNDDRIFASTKDEFVKKIKEIATNTKLRAEITNRFKEDDINNNEIKKLYEII